LVTDGMKKGKLSGREAAHNCFIYVRPYVNEAVLHVTLYIAFVQHSVQ